MKLAIAIDKVKVLSQYSVIDTKYQEACRIVANAAELVDAANYHQARLVRYLAELEKREEENDRKS